MYASIRVDDASVRTMRLGRGADLRFFVTPRCTTEVAATGEAASEAELYKKS